MVRPPVAVEHSPTGIGLLDEVFASCGRNLGKTCRILERILSFKLVAQLYTVWLPGRTASALAHTESMHRKPGCIANYMLAVTIPVKTQSDWSRGRGVFQYNIVAVGSNVREDARIVFGLLRPPV